MVVTRGEQCEVRRGEQVLVPVAHDDPRRQRDELVACGRVLPDGGRTLGDVDLAE